MTTQAGILKTACLTQTLFAVAFMLNSSAIMPAILPTLWGLLREFFCLDAVDFPENFIPAKFTIIKTDAPGGKNKLGWPRGLALVMSYCTRTNRLRVGSLRCFHLYYF